MLAAPIIQPFMERGKAHTLAFHEDGHKYLIDGNRAISNTQILEAAGITDYSDVPDYALGFARNRGTAVHLATEYHDTGMLDEKTLHPNIIPYFNAWKLFRKESKFEIEHIELLVGNALLMIAGRIDRVGIYQGKRTILDIKSGYDQGGAPAIQTGGYEYQYNKNFPKARAHQRLVIYLKKDGTWEPRLYKSQNDINVFLAAYTVARWKQVN